MAVDTSTEVKLLTFDLTSTTSVASGPAAGGPAVPMKAVALTFLADSANAAKVYFGGSGTPTFGLAAGASESLDCPPGCYLNVSELSVSGGGTSGLIIHVAAFVVP